MRNLLNQIDFKYRFQLGHPKFVKTCSFSLKLKNLKYKSEAKFCSYYQCKTSSQLLFIMNA